MAKEISQAKFFKVFAKTNGRCFYCNKIAEEIDHFIAKSWLIYAFGSSNDEINDVGNLVPSCKHCNASKNAKDPTVMFDNDYQCWMRSYRANRRVGVHESFPFPEMA